MKDFFEKLFDLLYDYIDYIIMLAIIIVVVAIIGWRLDLIFTDNGTSSNPPIEENLEDENDDESDENQLDEEDQPGDEDVDGSEEPSDSDDTSEEPDESESQVEGDIDIDIPSGTLPTGIASILLENQLIDSNEEFLNTVVEQNLETGLKAGLYTIPSGSSIDEILEILTN